MAFINFGYAISAARASASSLQARSTAPIDVGGISTASHNTGDLARADIARLQLMGGVFDFLWGSHVWGDSKKKVTD